jgi:hypothetical protein
MSNLDLTALVTLIILPKQIKMYTFEAKIGGEQSAV